MMMAVRMRASMSRSAITHHVQNSLPSAGRVIAVCNNWLLMTLDHEPAKEQDMIDHLAADNSPFDQVRILGLYPRPYIIPPGS